MSLLELSDGLEGDRDVLALVPAVDLDFVALAPARQVPRGSVRDDGLTMSAFGWKADMPVSNLDVRC